MRKTTKQNIEKKARKVIVQLQKMKGNVEDIPPMKRLPMVNGEGC